MRRQLVSDSEIEGVCQDLLSRSRRVLLEDVTRELQRRHGAKGRMARVALIFRRVCAESEFVPPATHPPGVALAPEPLDVLERLHAAERRAAESEERERGNQEFFARRFAEQCSELEAEKARWYATRDDGVSKEQYLRLYQRAVLFRERLSRHEPVEPLFGDRGPGGEDLAVPVGGSKS